MRSVLTINCQQCEKPFLTEDVRSLYCSSSCRQKYWRASRGRLTKGKSITRVCPCCRVEFVTMTAHKKFCSKKCARRLRVSQNPEGRLQERAQHFGITAHRYRQMVLQQDGLCAICGQPPAGAQRDRTLHIDHDHKTGKVRGLLCGPCNRGLGRYEKFPAQMQKYLEQHRESCNNGQT